MPLHAHDVREAALHRRHASLGPPGVPRDQMMCQDLSRGKPPRPMGRTLAVGSKHAATIAVAATGLLIYALHKVIRQASRQARRLEIQILCNCALYGSAGNSARLIVHVLPLDEAACKLELDRLLPLMAHERILGLDCEWEPETGAQQSRISVIQLSSSTDCLIFRPLHTTMRQQQRSQQEPKLTHKTTNGANSEGLGPAGVLLKDLLLPLEEPRVPEEQQQQQQKQQQQALSQEKEWVVTAASDCAECACSGRCSSPGGFIPDVLRALLEDAGVVKAGVGILEDVRRLKRDLGVNVRGALDVRSPLQELAPCHLASGSSLQALALSMLGVTQDKRWQCSAWQDRHLSKEQLVYAAKDAWLSRQLVVALLHGLHASQGTAACQERSAATSVLATLVTSIAPATGTKMTSWTAPAAPALLITSPAALAACSLEIILPYLDQLPQGRGLKLGGASGGTLTGSPRASGSAGGQKRVLRPCSMPTRKTELYENCRLLAPDGSLLCTCGLKKLQWYITRGLADEVGTEPPTARLKFEPRGRGHAGDEYYLSDKQNRCCVCGQAGDYLRHHIVPHCYRSHFPLNMKSHLSHDVVLMCQGCQQRCCSADHRRMAALGKQYGAPLKQDNHRFQQDSDAVSVKSATRALNCPKAAFIPADRRAALEQVLLSYFGVSEVTADVLARGEEVQPKKANLEWRSHSSLVVEGMEAQDIEAFVRSWRRHFVDVMKPKFLPPHWSVDSRVANSGPQQAQADDEAEGED